MLFSLGFIILFFIPKMVIPSTGSSTASPDTAPWSLLMVAWSWQNLLAFPWVKKEVTHPDLWWLNSWIIGFGAIQGSSIMFNPFGVVQNAIFPVKSAFLDSGKYPPFEMFKTQFWDGLWWFYNVIYIPLTMWVWVKIRYPNLIGWLILN